jgi:hypothetical protein
MYDMYNSDLELEAELEELMSVLLESDLESESETSEGDVGCTGCKERGCFAVLHQAILEAIRLANAAANKIDAAMADSGSKSAQETTRLFQAFFCHGPSFAVSGAGNAPSGASVANRFRSVAHELGPGREIMFICGDTASVCAKNVCCADDFARVDPPTTALDRRTIFLCARFWDARTSAELGGNPLRGLDDPRLQLVDRRFPGLPEVDRRAGIIIHETLHLLFDLGDDASPRRFDAHCYAAFALRVNGFGGDPSAVRRCLSLPCGNRI